MTATATRQRPEFVSRARSAPERRIITRDAVASPAAEGSNTIGFRGHAVVYNEWTEIMDPYWGDCWMEQIAAGACTASMAQDDVRLLLNHDPNYVLARRRGLPTDTLRLTEDGMGLLCEADMDSRVSYVRDLAVAIERGDISGMSFAFDVLDEDWEVRPDGQMWMRTIKAVRLYDVSPVTYPAYGDTDAQLRAGARPRRVFPGAKATREGKRNSSADEAILKSAIDRLGALAEQLQPLLEAEQAEGDNDDDVAILQSSIEIANDVATDLRSLLDEEATEPDEEQSSERKARAANEAHRHRALGAVLGIARVK